MLILPVYTLITLAAVLLPVYGQGATNEKIPDTFWEELSKMKTMKEFKEKFLNKHAQSRYLQEDDMQEGSVSNKPARRDEEGSGNEPEFPCQLTIVNVLIPVHNNSEIVRSPKYLTLPQCRGCCKSAGSMFKCSAKRTFKVFVEVHNDHQFDPRPPNIPTIENLTMVAHNECECRCSSNANSKCKSIRCENQNCGLSKKWNDESCSCEEEHHLRDWQNRRKSVNAVDVCTSEECSPGYKAVEMSGRCVCRPISIRDWISKYDFSRRRK